MLFELSKSKSVLPLFLLAACGSSHASNNLPLVPKGTKADRIFVDKSDRVLVLFAKGKEIARYRNIRLGDAPVGHKQFEGDEKTPEGKYTINGRNQNSRYQNSRYHLSLRVSYPNKADTAFAKSKRKSPGGDIFIHGQPNMSPVTRLGRDWTDGCIAVSNAEIEQLWKLVPDGAVIEIRS